MRNEDGIAKKCRRAFVLWPGARRRGGGSKSDAGTPRNSMARDLKRESGPKFWEKFFWRKIFVMLRFWGLSGITFLSPQNIKKRKIQTKQKSVGAIVFRNRVPKFWGLGLKKQLFAENTTTTMASA